MKISYKWLSDYLPLNELEAEAVTPDELSQILTSIGLEVESLERFESIPGGLQGLAVGKVIDCNPHPNADKLKITSVNIGSGDFLQIVCGAPNVAAGQTVIVATPGTTIHPLNADPVTMKIATIRGVESIGMICAADEIGLGEDHDGILILPDDLAAGTPVSDYYKPYSDWVFEIGLTPNRTDAMSHLGVARDLCAYFSHHKNIQLKPKLPFSHPNITGQKGKIQVTIKNTYACRRYAGITMNNITVSESPQWLQNRLKAIGQRPLNNIVDITNYIMHETGQPLHAFDADKIAGKTVIVQNLPEGIQFETLDGKTRTISADDLMICDEEKPMCIAGVFGGMHSGVTAATKNVFLESAWFHPASIRKTSLQHGLRTDAAARFEKGVDITGQAIALNRVVFLINQIAGGEIPEDFEDIYKKIPEKTNVTLKFSYLKKLSGKHYDNHRVKKLLTSLSFDILYEDDEELVLAVPYNKHDILLPADIVEEIIRIDGLDNIEIPQSIHISPSIDTAKNTEKIKEKLAGLLIGLGFNEIITNSITNSNLFSGSILHSAVKLVNSLSSELDIMRPTLLTSGLESIAYNVNRKINNLRFFEFGKTYTQVDIAQFEEYNKLGLFISGNKNGIHWREKSTPMDVYNLKGIIENIFKSFGFSSVEFEKSSQSDFGLQYNINSANTCFGQLYLVSDFYLQKFDLKQKVYYAEILLDEFYKNIAQRKIRYSEISKYPYVQRDLAIIVDKALPFADIEASIKSMQIPVLKQITLFDVFENEKLGNNKKSLAINFILQYDDKTLTDKETDEIMKKIIRHLESNLGSEIRK